MPLNQSLKGKTYDEVDLEVERTGPRSSRSRSGRTIRGSSTPRPRRAEGFPDQVVFPTFPTTIQILASAQVVLDQELGLDYTRVVHGEQEFEWRRPIVVGDRLRAQPRISDIYAKGPNEFLVIENEVRDADGEVVAISRSTLLSRGTAEGA